ncbi:MAG TPA: CocE/NonD family hydrolase [Solirubrobacteraceae bacterium]|nr:CocE/NonD family hydrolase [Solirubrobacteraceae bacterium]
MLALVVAAIALALGAFAGAARAADPFGHPCTAEYGVRFCPTATLAQRVRSFDGVPLDVDVTLPASGHAPFPTIVMLHGWGGSKTSYESTSPTGDGNETYAYNNVYYARHGFAVVNYSARGWGNSCGTAESRAEGNCQDGWMHMADQRYEARDTQFLLGVLVDEHIAMPGRLGVTGISYGGGQAVELAYLRNRIRLPDGSFAAWRSPAGRPLQIDAVWARWPWSDLIDALWPNGRFLDDELAPTTQTSDPIGVELEEWASSLARVGAEEAYVAPAGADPGAELGAWKSVLGGPARYSTQANELIEQLRTYHQGYGLPGRPAPLLLESGWTDDLLPPEQSLRLYNAIRAQHGQVALQLGDLGHSPAENKPNTDQAFNMQGARFFAAMLRHEGSAPANGSVSAYTLTCPASEPGGGPYTARSWSAVHPHRLAFGSAATQTFTSAGGDERLADELNPSGGPEACKTLAVQVEPNSATYTLASPGMTVLGLPTVTASVDTHGSSGEVAARLWDVMPDGRQRLVDRGIYRLTDDQGGSIAFQLHGDGYSFPAGDTVKLELLGRDAPYYRASEAQFSVEVSDLSISLPTT